jgi:hypothetical protein
MVPGTTNGLVACVRSFLVSHGLALAIVGLLCASVVVQTGWFRGTTSVTVDETFYLSVSIRSLRQGFLDSSFMRAGVAPLPMILNCFPALGWDDLRDQDRSRPWRGMPGDDRLIALPRLFTTLTSLVPLVILAFFWLKARRGIFAATFGAGLLAFSPTLLAHASLATHDATFALHATLAAIIMGWYFRAPGRWRLVAAALTTSLAISSKYTGFLLIPCFVLALTVRNVADLLRSRQEALRFPWLAWRKHVRPGVLFVVLTLAFTWALHGFQVTGNGRLLTFRKPTPDNLWIRTLGPGFPGRELALLIPVKVEEPGFVRALRTQIQHTRRGHPAFLMGMRSIDGWWFYFPVAVLLKSTFAELLLVLVGTALLTISTVRGYKMETLWRDPERALLLLFAGTLTVVLLKSHINIGHRYTIALYPVAVLAFTDLMAERLWERRVMLRTAGAALLGVQIVTSLAAAPHYLSYFNRLAGGPEQGWRYLADSNIDWGQDLPALKRLIEREGYRQVACDYFGTAFIEGYGIRADPIGSLSRLPTEYDAFVVSVTQLQSVYPLGAEPPRQIVDSYRMLRGLPPTFRAGHSLFVYDLRSPDVREAFTASATTIAMRLKPPESSVQTATRNPDKAVRR